MATALRPLTLGELLDRVFQLYRKHFVVFCGIAGIPYAVVLAAQLATLDFQSSPMTIGWAVTLPLLTLAGFAANGFAQAASVDAVSQLYLGRDASIGESFSRIRGRVLLLCVMTLGLGILIGLGVIALLLPGLYLLLRWALVVPAMIIEGHGIGGSMGRSAFLMNGQYLRALLIYVLYFILTMIFTSFFQVPVMVAAVMSQTPGVLPVWAQVLIHAGQFLAATFLSPLLTIAVSLLYYDSRVRKEAFDLVHMTEQIERAGFSTPATT